VNQFLRGELFIAADYVLTRRGVETGKEVEEAVSFLLGYIRESSKIMHESVEFLKEVNALLGSSKRNSTTICTCSTSTRKSQWCTVTRSSSSC
jgi:hypothetical protein